MGWVCLPEDLKDPTPLQLVQSAINNLELWKQHHDAGHLIAFASKDLERALRKINSDDSV